MRFRLADPGSANYLHPEAYLNNIKLIPVNSSTELVLGVATVDADGNQIVPQGIATGVVDGRLTVTTLGTDVGSAGLTTVTTTITENDTNDCVKIEVTGVAATNIRYTAYLVSTEAIYA